MDRHNQTKSTRRELLRAALAMPAVFILASNAIRTIGQPSPEAIAGEPALPPTPACADDDHITPSQMEGPYYKPRSPERTSLLEPGTTGTKIVLTGYVLSRRCRPIVRALLDFWQADDKGDYDNGDCSIITGLFSSSVYVMQGLSALTTGLGSGLGR